MIKFYDQVFQKFISWQPLIRKHSYLDRRYLGGWLWFHDSWPQGPCLGQLMCFSTFLLWKQLMQIDGQTSVIIVTLTFGPWNEGQLDVYFMVQWFCLISWRLFVVWTPYFGIMSQFEPMFDLKFNVGHCDLYFMVKWFCLTSWSLFNVWTTYFGIMSQYDHTDYFKMNVGHCDLYFMVHWFYFIYWRLFDVWISYFVIMSQYDLTFDLKYL